MLPFYGMLHGLKVYKKLEGNNYTKRDVNLSQKCLGTSSESLSSLRLTSDAVTQADNIRQETRTVYMYGVRVTVRSNYVLVSYCNVYDGKGPTIVRLGHQAYILRNYLIFFTF